MIIGFEAKKVFENRSGLGNYSRNTINLLAKYFPENRYKLFAQKNTDLFSLPESAEIITPSTKITRFFSSYWRVHLVPKILKSNKVDVFHGLSQLLPFGVEKTGIPSVTTIHDLIFLRFPNFYKKIDRNLYLSFSKSSCQRATKVLAISHQTKEDIIHFLGISPEKIEVIYQTCNQLFYEKASEAQKQAVRKKFNLPSQFILSVGTIELRKNQLELLKGVVHEKLDIPVVILGRPRPKDYKKILDEYILESGIRKQLIFLHGTNTQELQTIYQMADVMVYPSLYEGFGLPVLEAQASGCPVITSNVSSLPEAGGIGAIYIDPRNKEQIGYEIRRILTDSALKNDMILKGSENALLFKDHIVADNLMKLYRSIC